MQYSPRLVNLGPGFCGVGMGCHLTFVDARVNLRCRSR